MIQQIITLPLGGQERTLLFGVNGYFEYIKEASGMDPFDFLEKFDKDVAETQSSSGRNIMVMIDDTAIMVYAGLNSFLDSRDEANISFDKVKKWCNGLSNDMTVEIFKTAFGTISEPGKLEPLPEQANGQGKVNA